MPSLPETILATLPGASDRDRVLVVLCQAAGGTHVEIRQQSWGEGLGWYTQSSVQLEPQQVAGMRQALGLGGAFAKVKVSPFAATGPTRSNGFTPRVVHADSA